MSAPPTPARRSTAQLLERLLHPSDQRRILEAIRAAELSTSAELKVHVEARCPAADPHTRAVELFTRLGLHRTEARNAVLLYAAVHDRRFAIVGDAGLEEPPGAPFWTAPNRRVSIAFRRGAYGEGLAGAVELLGEQLRRRFPGRAGKKDELDNELSTEDTEARA